MFAVSKISEKGGKQTQGYQLACFQQLTAVFAPILKKYEWNYEPSCDVL
jgi:hypothetical protein